MYILITVLRNKSIFATIR